MKGGVVIVPRIEGFTPVDIYRDTLGHEANYCPISRNPLAVYPGQGQAKGALSELDKQNRDLTPFLTM